MAYLPNYSDEDEQNGGLRGKPVGAAGGGSMPQGAPGAAGPQAPTGPGPAAPAAGGAPGAGSGQFINFSSYLNANQDAATRTANQMTSNASAGADSAQRDLAGLQDQFGKDSAAGTPFAPPGSGTVAMPRGSGAGLTGMGTPGMAPPPPAPQFAGGTPHAAPGSMTGGAPADPNQPSLETMQANAAKSYTGPVDLTGYAQYGAVDNSLRGASQTVQATGSTGGRQALLQDQVGGAGGYGQGSSLLDSGLTGAAGGQGFAALRQKYAGLDSALGNANTAAATQATGAAAYAKGQAADWQARADAKKANDAAQAAIDAARVGKQPSSPGALGSDLMYGHAPPYDPHTPDYLPGGAQDPNKKKNPRYSYNPGI